MHWDGDASSGAVVDTFMDLDAYLKANKPTRLSNEFRVRHDLAATQALIRVGHSCLRHRAHRAYRSCWPCFGSWRSPPGAAGAGCDQPARSLSASTSKARILDETSSIAFAEPSEAVSVGQKLNALATPEQGFCPSVAQTGGVGTSWRAAVQDDHR